jgi:hypothetical protein
VRAPGADLDAGTQNRLATSVGTDDWRLMTHIVVRDERGIEAGAGMPAPIRAGIEAAHPGVTHVV